MEFEPIPPTVTGVTVNPNPVDVQRGTTHTFNATVTGTNNPAQMVTWSVTGGGANTGIDTNGKLTVAFDEIASTLTVTAVSPVDTNISGSSTVTVTDSAPPVIITGVIVTPGAVTLDRGGSQQFSAEVTGINPPQDVEWSVEGGTGSTSISSTGVLTIDADETATTLTVRATAANTIIMSADT